MRLCPSVRPRPVPSCSCGKKARWRRAESHEPAVPNSQRAREKGEKSRPRTTYDPKNVAARHAAWFVSTRPGRVLGGTPASTSARIDHPEGHQHGWYNVSRSRSQACERRCISSHVPSRSTHGADGRRVTFFAANGNAILRNRLVSPGKRVGDPRRFASTIQSATHRSPRSALACGFPWSKDQALVARGVRDDRSWHGLVGVVPRTRYPADEPNSQLRRADTFRNPRWTREWASSLNDSQTVMALPTYEWFVVNPINNYAIAVAGFTYAHYTETYD